MTVAEIMEQAKSLSREERKTLVKLLVDTLDMPTVSPSGKKHSILELAGLGEEIWEGIDVQEYLNQLSSEWDHRPQS
jgi:hypothetical protein